MTGPLDYSLCNQTITIYRKEKNIITQKEISGCYYAWEEVQSEDEFGIRRETKCILILPGGESPIYIGDKVYPGIGPSVRHSDWNNFLPVTVPGLAVINYVTPCYWEGEICHLEAGRK